MVDASLEGILGRPFPEQVAALRLRLGNRLPTSRWDDLRKSAHDRAFVVAGATKADLLADLAGAVDKAITEGRGLEEFRRDFRRIVSERGWSGWTGEGTLRGEAWRTRVIYRTNARVSYAAGRRAQLIEAGFPLWIYRHGGSRDPRPEHLALDGVTLPPDHPFWETWSPPNGWGCSCYVSGARSPQAVRRMGGDPDKGLPEGWDRPDARTGAPRGIDKGWDYAPGATVSDAIRALDGKLPQLPAEIGAALSAGMPPAARTARLEAFGAFFDQVTARGRAEGAMMVVGAMQGKWIAGARKHGLTPATAEIAVTDRAILHTFRDAKARPLDKDWYRQLPLHLETPEMVLLGTRTDPPTMLLIFSSPGTGAKLAVRLNYSIKKHGTFNAIQSGALMTPRELGAQLGSPGIVVLDGM